MQTPEKTSDAQNLSEILSRKIVGQSAVMECIVPAVQMYLSGLAPTDRPAGVFLLLGPTGTGKTRTVEALAEVLHGSPRKLLKINCGEFQLEHEVTKLTGAPPGYVGHRETSGILSAENLRKVTTPECDLAIILFDEIEKAAPSLTHLLLGLLDKGTVRLGDNTEVDFEKSIIFFTSNLGAREMMNEIRPELGFRHSAYTDPAELEDRLERVSLGAVKRRFSPEFVNRLDAAITYRPLDKQSFATILQKEIVELQSHVNMRLGGRRFEIEVSEEGLAFLLNKGTSPEYGAREIKRVIHRHLTQPLASWVMAGKIAPGSRVKFEVAPGEERLTIVIEKTNLIPPDAPRAESWKPTILIVDDNVDLLQALADCFRAQTDAHIITADCADTAIEAIFTNLPDVALLDWILPDGNGVTIGAHLKRKNPKVQVIIMTGAELSVEEKAICDQYSLRFLRKPFLAAQALAMVRELISRSPTSAP